jgi:galactonate dehydratase
MVVQKARGRGVFAVEDGYVARPTGPSLGIEIDESEVRRVAASPRRRDDWRHADGSFAEW